MPPNSGLGIIVIWLDKVYCVLMLVSWLGVKIYANKRRLLGPNKQINKLDADSTRIIGLLGGSSHDCK